MPNFAKEFEVNFMQKAMNIEEFFFFLVNKILKSSISYLQDLND